MSPIVIFQREGFKEEKIEISEETLMGLFYGVRERYLGMKMALNPTQSKELGNVQEALSRITRGIER